MEATLQSRAIRIRPLPRPSTRLSIAIPGPRRVYRRDVDAPTADCWEFNVTDISTAKVDILYT
jgi:hypothetical protein